VAILSVYMLWIVAAFFEIVFIRSNPGVGGHVFIAKATTIYLFT